MRQQTSKQKALKDLTLARTQASRQMADLQRQTTRDSHFLKALTIMVSLYFQQLQYLCDVFPYWFSSRKVTDKVYAV